MSGKGKGKGSVSVFEKYSCIVSNMRLTTKETQIEIMWQWNECCPEVPWVWQKVITCLSAACAFLIKDKVLYIFHSSILVLAWQKRKLRAHQSWKPSWTKWRRRLKKNYFDGTRQTLRTGEVWIWLSWRVINTTWALYAKKRHNDWHSEKIWNAVKYEACRM